MNVFIYELRQNRKSIITWSIAYVIIAFVLLSATPLFINESSAMKEVLSGFPDAAKDAMGIDIDMFFSEVGFYSYIFLYISLTAAIQAMNLGIGIISKENRMLTADFLMSKPKSRVSVYLQKLLSAFCSLVITEAAFMLSAYLSMLYVSGGDFAVVPFMLISATFFFIQMIFLAAGLFLATVITKIKSAVTVTMGVCFGTFMLGMISAIAGSDMLRYFSPLKYFDNNYIMMNKAYESKYLVISAVLVIVLTAASFIVYIKKDIKAVT